MALTFRDLFKRMSASGMTEQQARSAVEVMNFDVETQPLDTPIPPELLPGRAPAPPPPEPEGPAEAGAPSVLRSLAPGMPVIAGVTDAGLVPVETIVFSEQEADLSAPATGAEERFGDVVPPPRPSAPEAPPTAEEAPEEAPIVSQEDIEGVRLPGGVLRSVGEAGKLALRELASGLTGSALTDPSLELALAADRGELEPEPEPEPEGPDFLARVASRSLSSGKPLTIENVMLAGFAESLETPVHYLADTLGTVAGVAVGAVEPLAAGLVGIGAKLGIPGLESAYDAAVTRMERTMLETSKFYEGKLSKSLIKNIRSNVSEIPSSMFHIMEGLMGGAMTADELSATSAIERMKIAYALGRTLGAQMTEGAIAAFALLASDPGRAFHADPVGTFMTIAPIAHGIRAGKISIDMSKMPVGATAFIERTASLYDSVVDHLVNSNEVTSAVIAQVRLKRAQTDRALSVEGTSIERLEQDFFEGAFREPDVHESAAKSAGEEFARETKRATERGETPVPTSVAGRRPARTERPPSAEAPEVPARKAALGEDDAPVSTLFRPDEGVSDASPLREREFEVFHAHVDPLTGFVELKPSKARKSLAKDLEARYVARGMDPEKAAAKASKRASEAADRGVQGYKTLDLEVSKDRLIKALGGAARRIVEELGGSSIFKKKGSKGKKPTSGLVDLDSDEFLVAMGEAIDSQAANILASATLRRTAVKAIVKRFEEALGEPLAAAQKSAIGEVVHNAASRMPRDRGALGSTKTYDVVFELPDGKRVSLLESARGIVTDDRKLAGLVFEESILATAERLSQKVKQRRRLRGWLEAFGGRDALKRGGKPSAVKEATDLAERWIADRAAGREPSLPAGFLNDPRKIFGALEQLPPHLKGELPASFWARFRGGKHYKPMSKEMLEHVGLVEMSQDMQQARRAVRIDAPFKSDKDISTIYVPDHIHNVIDLQMRSEAWRVADTWLAKLERSAKGNMVARNLSSLVNAMNGNIMYQMVRRGDPLVAGKMILAVKRYRKWRNGELTDPKEIRMFESIDRTGVLDSTYVQSELNKAYAGSNKGLLDQTLDRTAAGRWIKGLIDMQESAFSWTDAGAKLEDAIHSYKQLDGYMDMVKPGEWIQGRVSANRSARIYKDTAGRWRLDGPKGRVLSDAQLSAVQARISVRPGLNAFFDYNDISRAARWLRGGSKAGAIVGVAGNAYWTWQNKAMTIVGVQRGLAGYAMTDGVPILTNSKAVKLAQARSHVAVGFRRAAMVQGARNTLGDREYHEALRNAAQYASSTHAGAVATFNRLADPNYIAVKHWSNASFLEPFDNLLGVIDALVSSPDTPSAAEVRIDNHKNKDLKQADNLYAGYDDMTMFYGSLDPNNAFDLESVFPTIPPSERTGKFSTAMDKAIAAADDRSLRGIPEEHRAEALRVRNIWREAWSGRTSFIASAAELAGATGGLLDRAWSASKDLIKAGGGERAWMRVHDQFGPLLMGGTHYKLMRRAIEPMLGNPEVGGTVWRHLPKGAEYEDWVDMAWAAVAGLGKFHMRAAGRPNSSVGERRGILDRDFARVKGAMRKSIRDTLGNDIAGSNGLNVSIVKYEQAMKDGRVPDITEEQFEEIKRQRDTALWHWHKLMGSAKPGETGKPSKGGLVNHMAAKYKHYIMEGWARAPAEILTPGEERKGMPRHTMFDLF